jgi:hypothetical protein
VLTVTDTGKGMTPEVVSGDKSRETLENSCWGVFRSWLQSPSMHGWR